MRGFFSSGPNCPTIPTPFLPNRLKRIASLIALTLSGIILENTRNSPNFLMAPISQPLSPTKAPAIAVTPARNAPIPKGSSSTCSACSFLSISI